MFDFAPVLAKKSCGSSLQQRGSALIIALVFLLILTLLGVSAMQGTSQEEKMAGNLRDLNLAFQGAEAVSKLCMRNIPNNVFSPAQNPGTDPATFWGNYFANANPQISYTYLLPGLNQSAMCISEDITLSPTANDANCLDTSVNCYRVIGYSVGGTTNAIAIIETKCYRRLSGTGTYDSFCTSRQFQ